LTDAFPRSPPERSGVAPSTARRRWDRLRGSVVCCRSTSDAAPSPPHAGPGSVRALLAFLEGKRVLYYPDCAEQPDRFILSVIEIRRQLTTSIGEVSPGSIAETSMRAMRTACITFLDTLDSAPPLRFALFSRRHQPSLEIALRRLRAVALPHMDELYRTYAIEPGPTPTYNDSSGEYGGEMYVLYEGEPRLRRSRPSTVDALFLPPVGLARAPRPAVAAPACSTRAVKPGGQSGASRPPLRALPMHVPKLTTRQFETTG
jgi:hypothetical protein